MGNSNHSGNYSLKAYIIIIFLIKYIKMNITERVFYEQ